MSPETLEQKTLDAGRILNGLKKALVSKNPDRAVERIRNVVSKAGYAGTIDSYSLADLSRKTQKLIEKYPSKSCIPEN